MRRLYQKVDERIYNPFGDEPISSTEYLIKKYGNNPDVFISFTELDKLGINPQSRYDTPLGIYAYPLAEILGSISNKDRLNKKIGMFVPFAGNSPWVWVVRVNRSAGKFIDDLIKYTDKELEEDLDWIIENRYESALKGLHNEYPTLTDDLLKLSALQLDYDPPFTLDQKKDMVRNTYMQQVGKDARFPNDPGGIFWNITRIAAQKNPVQWNKLFRDLGYIGVADKSGMGIIHPQENQQAVFFSRKSFKVLEQIENYEVSSNPKEDLEKIETMVKKVFVKGDENFAPNLVVEIAEFVLKYYKIRNKYLIDVVDMIDDVILQNISTATATQYVNGYYGFKAAVKHYQSITGEKLLNVQENLLYLIVDRIYELLQQSNIEV